MASSSKQCKSKVWDFFEKEGPKKVRCTLCCSPGTVLAYHGGTTSMRSHLTSQHPKEFIPAASSQGTLDTFVSKQKCSTQRSQEITRRIVDMVARDLRPISVVEGDGFKNLLKFIEPGYRVPSHTHIATVCRRTYTTEKEKLKEEIAKCEYIAMTTDIWTSSAVHGYMTVTVHFIDSSWKLCSKVLSTAEMPERHTGVNISERLAQTSLEWGITDAQVSAIVNDNAANAVLAADLTGWPHFGCVAHTLQLCIKSGLDIPVIVRLASACRKLVGHFKHSVVAMTALREKQAQLEIPQHNLVQDVATRWNSTYFMLERLFEQRVAVYAVLHATDKDKHLDLKEEQWELVSQMVTVLKPLQVATTVFSFEQYASCSIVYPIINGLISNHLTVQEYDKGAIKTCKRNITNQLEQRFNPSSLDTAKSLPVLCVAVDPRYSDLTFLSTEQREITQDEIVDQVEALTLREPAEPPPKKKKKEKAMDFLLGSNSEATEESQETTSASKKEEVNRFTKEPNLDRDKNPLEWWKVNKERFPRLSLLAKKLLCIPATSVPSERIFSVAGNIVTKKQSSLKPENVDMLVFLHENLPPI